MKSIISCTICNYFFCSAKYKCKLGKRLIQEYERSNPSTSSSESSGPKVFRPKPALDRMEFVLHTTAFPTKERDELKKKFIRLGAKVVSQVSDMTMAVISTEGLSINLILFKHEC
jgi:NAD-dependent DNA ligase